MMIDVMNRLFGSGFWTEFGLSKLVGGSLSLYAVRTGVS